MKLPLVALLGFLLLSQSTYSQTNTSGVPSATPNDLQLVREPAAIVAAQRAISAMGGDSLITGLRAIEVDGSISMSVGSATRAGTFVWKNQVTDKGFEFRQEVTIDGNTSVFASGHGNPANRGAKGRVHRLAQHVAYAAPPFHLPAVLLESELADKDRSFLALDAANINGHPAVHIQTSVSTGPVETLLSVHDWYFDASSGLPLRVDYRVPDSFDAARYQPASADYADYRDMDGVATPVSISATQAGAPIAVVSISNVQWKAALNPSDFDLVAGGVQ